MINCSKENAVKYYETHRELTIQECAKKLGIPIDVLHVWIAASKRLEDDSKSNINDNILEREKRLAEIEQELLIILDQLNELRSSVF